MNSYSEDQPLSILMQALATTAHGSSEYIWLASEILSRQCTTLNIDAITITNILENMAESKIAVLHRLFSYRKLFHSIPAEILAVFIKEAFIRGYFVLFEKFWSDTDLRFEVLRYMQDARTPMEEKYFLYLWAHQTGDILAAFTSYINEHINKNTLGIFTLFAQHARSRAPATISTFLKKIKTATLQWLWKNIVTEGDLDPICKINGFYSLMHALSFREVTFSDTQNELVFTQLIKENMEGFDKEQMEVVFHFWSKMTLQAQTNFVQNNRMHRLIPFILSNCSRDHAFIKHLVHQNQGLLYMILNEEVDRGMQNTSLSDWEQNFYRSLISFLNLVKKLPQENKTELTLLGLQVYREFDLHLQDPQDLSLLRKLSHTLETYKQEAHRLAPHHYIWTVVDILLSCVGIGIALALYAKYEYNSWSYFGTRNSFWYQSGLLKAHQEINLHANEESFLEGTGYVV